MKADYNNISEFVCINGGMGARRTWTASRATLPLPSLSVAVEGLTRSVAQAELE